jgi:hypothetical protein
LTPELGQSFFERRTENKRRLQPHQPRDYNGKSCTFKMDNQDDGLKSFGEGFDGFPKQLPEDCVEYSLFVIDSKLKSQKELLSRLEVVRKESLKLTDSLIKDYIWQRESFLLELESGKGMWL